MGVTATQMIAAIDEAIHALIVGRPIQNYRLPGGESIQYMSLQELQNLRDKYAEMEELDEARARKTNRNVVRRRPYGS